MQKWVICWINWQDYKMHMDTVSAPDEEWALVMALHNLVGIEDPQEWSDYIKECNTSTPESIKQEAFNVDGMVGVHKVVFTGLFV